VPPDILSALDEIAAELSQGAVRATRASVAVEALREFVERHRVNASGARAPVSVGSPAPRAARKAAP
jgi:predicted transcriptional regulator